METDKNFIPKEVYETIVDKMPVCTVDVIFLNKQKNKTLLFKRNNNPLKGEYFSIGGKLNKDETFLECAIRQAKMEIGLEIDPEKTIFIGVQREYYPNSAFDGISYTAVDLYFGYILDKQNLSLKLDEQHSESKWFEINDKDLHPYIKSKIEQTLLIV